MSVAEFQRILSELRSFADDEDEIDIDNTGEVVMTRGGQTLEFKLVRERDAIVVHNDEVVQNYRSFLARNIARLDVMASKLLEKRGSDAVFIDGPAVCEKQTEPTLRGSALTVLDRECCQQSPFSSRVIFVTADAGHGKTYLLRQYQQQTAQRFTEAQCDFLFWHVDLQGRQLLRLSEALMGNLAELRMPGLWMPSVVTLLKRRLLVIGIDGFDELAAEQGSTDALGALALLVQQMQGEGTIVAASRRTFFDTENYLRRSKMLKGVVSRDCEFHQIRLEPWTREESEQYLGEVYSDGRRISEPKRTYREILNELDGDNSHPLLTRPFLLARLAQGLLLYDVSPHEFIRGLTGDSIDSVATVVQAFVKREVEQKWRHRDSGEPYLTERQHMIFLSAVAEEMWMNQVERLDTSVIEVIIVMLLESWDVTEEHKRAVIDMTRMHVLLNPAQSHDGNSRAFDHVEIRNYFLALALEEHIGRALASESEDQIAHLLSVAQLPDEVAKFTAGLCSSQSIDKLEVVNQLVQVAAREWRPTYLQQNVGTLIPYLLDGLTPRDTVEVNARLVYSSLVFERTALGRVRFSQGTFTNVSFVDVSWNEVEFVKCAFDMLTIDPDSSLRNVTFQDCSVDGVRLVRSSDELFREYAPAQIRSLLERCGITVRTGTTAEVVRIIEDGPDKRLAKRFMRIFARSMGVSNYTIEKKFGSEAKRVISEIVPIMERHGIIEECTWHGKGKGRRWLLRRSVEDVLRADGGDGEKAFVQFWAELDT